MCDRSQGIEKDGEAGAFVVRTRRANTGREGAVWTFRLNVDQGQGGNLTIEYRFANTRFERLPALAAELVGLKMDVIVAPSTHSR
jgi:hypothetical protein